MSQLAKIHPKFFPDPVEDKDGIGEDGMPYMIRKTKGYLTQKEAGALWARTGDSLHRGSAKAALADAQRPLKFDEIRSWRDKVVRLLTRHTIISPDELTLVHLVMNNAGTNEIGWNIMKAVDGSAPSRPVGTMSGL